MEGTKIERKRTLTMNFDGLDDDDDDRFFESCERISSAVPVDLMSSGSDEEDEFFEASRMSVASAASGFHSQEFRNFAASPETVTTTAPASPDYNVWMAAPGSITERRKRLLQDMGLSTDKELLSFKRVVSNKLVIGQVPNSAVATNGKNDNNNNKETKEEPKNDISQQESSHSPVPVVLVRSRSEGDIEMFSVDRSRKEELIGSISKQRLTRTSSMIFAPQSRICPYGESVRVANKGTGNGRSGQQNGSLTSIISNSRFGAFFLIKNLDTGKEFVVNGYDEDGMWNKLSDLQTGKQLTMEEFEKSVGYSPVVKELMRRENVSRENESKLSANSYLSKSLRMSKRRGAALLKNIREVASSINRRGDNKEKESSGTAAAVPEHKQGKNSAQSNNNNSNSQWVKVRQTGKSCKELSALHLCQEIHAHEGSIWTIKFSLDSRYLASAGEDRIIHVWEVQECEVMSMSEGNLTPLPPSMPPLHSSLCNASDKSFPLESPPNPPEKKKKGKNSSNKKGDTIPDYVHVPETVFALSEKPVCSFKGHLDDVLDLSWSRSQLLLSSSMDKTVRLWDMETNSCLKLFAHNDYVTCIQFNPVDDDYFISGSLDAKVRIWSIPDRQVVDWTDLHEMVTAACYTPDGQSALIGSHKGSCRMYSTEDYKLDQQNQLDLKNKKKSNAKKITGFQFSPSNPTEVLVTSADSGIRIFDSSDLVQKLSGFRNTSSQIAASFSSNGKYVVCASEDSQVYVWKREEPRNSSSGKKNLINTRSHEHFQCRDVSAALPWYGAVKGDPPQVPIHSKRHSKRLGSQPSSANCSPTKEDSHAGGLSKRLMLPPLPKKNNNKIERVSTPPEDELAQISRTDSGLGDSFCSNSSSIRCGDSPSISAASEPNSSSVRHDDSPSLSSSIRHGSPSSSLRQGDSASLSAATGPNSSSIRQGDSSSSSWSSSWFGFDGGNHSSQTVQPTAWGLVIVTATLGGEIRAYQNFGLPRRPGRQNNLF